ncbi:hypothetical protein FVER14953_21507 [Fusarium verticillioides]|nr:hypothetical protein FVER14953_21507 [Fusarium verticillioides]
MQSLDVLDAHAKHSDPASKSLLQMNFIWNVPITLTYRLSCDPRVFVTASPFNHNRKYRGFSDSSNLILAQLFMVNNVFLQQEEQLAETLDNQIALI